MITEMVGTSECTGCGGCYQICPRNAIEMKPDRKGFLYPQVLKEKCSECGLCKKVCPVIKDICINEYDTVAYAAWSKNEKIRYCSTSGGVFTEIANYVIENGGCVVGAKYADNHLVEHSIIFEKDDIGLLRQSKYVQSNLGNIFKEVKSQLQLGKNVLFVGTPCQCVALSKFLGGDNEKLILCDFICRGVNAPNAYMAYLQELEERYQSEIQKVWFKNKKHGWNHFGTKIIFANGEEYYAQRNDDPFMYGYIKKELNLYMRSCCNQCKFKGISRATDLTLGDFWGYKVDVNEKDYGVSAVMVHSSKGEKILEAVNSLHKELHTTDEIIKGNICLEKSAQKSEYSDYFWKCMDEKVPFSKIIERIKRGIN